MEKADIRALDESVLTQAITELGFPAFRSRQIKQWLDKGVTDFAQMTNLPADLREHLSARYRIPCVRILKKWESSLDDTVKYLYELEDGETVESVLMHYHHGWSQCLSTQVGCRMGCSFCATGMGGLVRNLTAFEMIAQIETAQKDCGIRVSSIVLMGMGEPLDNFTEVTRFLDYVSTEGGVHIGMRHISLSTCGLVDKIRLLMERDYALTLSVSLHAPNDTLRSRLMAVNRRWPIEELLSVCREYVDRTGRRISFEYAMIRGVNDTDACAHELAQRIKGMLCHVNLIPANEVEGKAHKRSSNERLRAFQNILQKQGITTTIRRTLGRDIEASCGQLRRKADRERRNEECVLSE